MKDNAPFYPINTEIMERWGKTIRLYEILAECGDGSEQLTQMLHFEIVSGTHTQAI